MASLAPTADEVAAALYAADVPGDIPLVELLDSVHSTGVVLFRGAAPEARLEALAGVLDAWLRSGWEHDWIRARLAVACLDDATFALLAAHADEVMP